MKQRVNMKIVTVTLRNQKVSPRKGQLMMTMVRGMKADKALDQLAFAKQKSARFVYSLLKSAIAAAKDKDYKVEDLFISESICQEGPRMKRFYIRARGRSTSFHKRLSHFKISLSKVEGPVKKEKAASKDEKIEKKTQTSKKESSNGTKS